MSSTSSSTTSLPRFGELPIELRLQIWALTASADEYIVVKMSADPFLVRLPKNGKGKDSTDFRDTHTFKFRLTLRGLHLPTLGVNRESREVTLQENPDFIQSRGQRSISTPRLTSSTLTGSLYIRFTSTRIDSHSHQTGASLDQKDSHESLSYPELLDHIQNAAINYWSGKKDSYQNMGPLCIVQYGFNIELPNAFQSLRDYKKFCEDKFKPLVSRGDIMSISPELKWFPYDPSQQ
ncbi:hypothetical protein G7Y89_g12353 [Cudoniella acicularis]|uniref:2EXR domain-containing protein n=1 Tax=Cudoniella acicularis TaxID=354080 RepID=A0A8H4VZR3_9HELO|nr:hypothetical protein G7Y89_g12353 [Cudoniella acicularis]